VMTPEVTLELPRETRFNLVRVREHTPLGQRVGEFAVDVWKDGAWSPFGNGTSIGMCRILRSEQPVTATRVRLRIIKAEASPAISELALFAEGA